MLNSLTAANVTRPAICSVLLSLIHQGSTLSMPNMFRDWLSAASAQMLITAGTSETGPLFRMQMEAAPPDSYV